MLHGALLFLFQSYVRFESAEALRKLRGIMDKDQLWRLMEELGMGHLHSSKEDEVVYLRDLYTVQQTVRQGFCYKMTDAHAFREFITCLCLHHQVQLSFNAHVACTLFLHCDQ